MNILNLNQPADLLLRERLKPYIEEATSPATRAAYRNDLGHFKAWGGTLPCTPQVVADYLVTHAETLAVATLQRRLAAISRAHNTLNCPNPTQTELVRLTMRGIRRKRGTAQRQVKALVKEDLLLIVLGLDDGTKACRDAALLLVGFCGAFRRSELVALNVEDIQFVHQGIVITLRRSKTDQEGQGRCVGIPYGRGHICPVKSLQAWLERSGISKGAIFRPTDRHNNVAPSRLTDRAVAKIIKARAAAVGLRADDQSGHSLRAGLATSAAQHGIASHKIKAQTGHRSDAMLARYIRDGDVWAQNASGLF